MHVTMGDDRFKFERLGIEVLETGLENIFMRFDKMTLGKLICQKKYEHLREQTERCYLTLVDLPAGQALKQLKDEKNGFYKEFLNNYGDLTYSKFVVQGREKLLQKNGVYMILCDEELVFTGVCARSFKERFNQHIGNISAKGCFRDGTATHCHINAQLTRKMTDRTIYFAVCEMENKKEMNQLKNAIINRFEPVWNLRATNDALSLVSSY